MKSIKGLSFYNSEGSLIDVEELYAQVQQLEEVGATKIIIGETASTTSTTSSDIDELAGTETDISLTNADDFKAGDMGISVVTVTDRNNSHGFMVFLALADEPDQPAGTLHVRFITGIYNGKDGTDGQGATIAVGEVTTGAAGTQASVTNSGTANAAVLDFTIPKGADGASGVTDVTAGSPTEQNGYTVTPVTFNFEQGNSKTVNIQAKNGEGAGLQQNDVINRTASVSTADKNSPDFVENNGDLWVKKITGYTTEIDTLSTTLPSERSGTSAATAPNGKIYLFGGYASGQYFDDILEFDPVTQSVTTLAPRATLPNAVTGASAATAPNGNIYIFGGGGARGTYVNDIVKLDPVTLRAGKLGTTLPTARAETSAATAPNGKIYVFGGSGDTSGVDILEFDPVTRLVTTLEATMPQRITHASAATASNGKIYVFTSRKIFEFDPVTQSVTTLEATLPSVAGWTSAASAPNGKIYVFGGADGMGVGATYLNDIVEFDPIAQSVTKLGATLPTTRIATSAATAPNGKIYVFGGVGATYVNDIVEFGPPAAQYAYFPAVVLSQSEYTQLKNTLQGIFAVGISAPSATVNGTLTAGNTTINGTLTTTGDISAQNVTANGAVTADSAEINGAVSANSAEVSGTLSAGNTTVNGTLTATGKITAPSATVNGELTADSVEVNGTLSAGSTTVNGTLSASGAVTVDGTVTASSFNATT